MNKISPKEFNKLIDWLFSQQQQNKTTFKAREFRIGFGLTPDETHTRLRRFCKLGIIKRSSKNPRGFYEINPFTSEELQQIKHDYSPLKTSYGEYEFQGENLTLKEIFNKYKPRVKLQHFTQRIRRGWSIEKALKEPRSNNRELGGS